MDYYVYRWLGPTGSYIGKGKGKRAYSHFNVALSGSRDCPRFYNAIRKYGAGAFRLVWLLTGLSEEEALRDEVLAIYLIEPEYNLTAGGDGTSGHIKTPESRARIAAASRGRVTSAETKAKLSQQLRGRPRPEAVKTKISLAHSGRKKTPEHRAAMAAARRGKPLTEAHKTKIAAAGLGRRHSEETKSKIGEAHKGRKKSPESVTRQVNAMWNRTATQHREVLELAAAGVRQTEIVRTTGVPQTTVSRWVRKFTAPPAPVMDGESQPKSIGSSDDGVPEE